jgi:hypothetical protein
VVIKCEETIDYNEKNANYELKSGERQRGIRLKNKKNQGRKNGKPGIIITV